MDTKRRYNSDRESFTRKYGEEFEVLSWNQPNQQQIMAMQHVLRKAYPKHPFEEDIFMMKKLGSAVLLRRL